MAYFKMKQGTNKTDTKSLKINKGLDISRKSKAKLLFFEVASESEIGLSATYFLSTRNRRYIFSEIVLSETTCNGGGLHASAGGRKQWLKSL